MILSSASALIFVGLAATASPSTRIALVVDETLDGAARDASEVEAALLEHLGAREGLVFVDASRAEAVRSAAAGRPLSSADVSALVGAVDADLLIVGEAELATADAGLLPGVTAVEGSARLRVVATDSAQVLGALRARAVGSHYSPKFAAAKAAEALAKALEPKLDGLLERPTRLELSLALPAPIDGPSADTLVRCIAALDEVKEARLLHLAADRAKIELSSGLDAPTLARRFSEADASCGVRVLAQARRVLNGRYEPEANLRVPVIARAFRHQGQKQPRDRWLATELPRAFLAELGGRPFLDVDLGAGLDRPVPEQGLELRGSFARRGDEMRVTVELLTAKRTPVLRLTPVCPSEARASCLSEAARELASKTFDALQRHREELPRLSERRAEGLSFESLALKGIKPAEMANRPGGQAIGTATVLNRAAQPVVDVELSVQIEGLSLEPGRARIARLAPGESAEIPVRVVLAADALREHDGNQIVAARLRASGRLDGASLRTERTTGVLVYARGAMDWRSAPSAAAAFVTPEHPAVRARVSEARKGLARTPPGALAEPLALAMTIASVRYGKDPVNPFAQDELDYVQFPAETLQSGAGDCDDLAVLYASLLEAAGHPALLVLVPGHMFAAVGLDLPPSAAGRVSPEPGATFEHGGRLWVPVETTRLGEGFDAAWRAGARRFGEEAEPTLISVREGWRAHPPADLYRGPTPSPSRLDSAAVETALASLESARSSAVEAQVRTLRNHSDAPSQNRAAVLLGLEGRTDEARSVLETVLGGGPNAPAENNLGNLRLLAGAPAEAEARYQRALDLAPAALPILLNATIASYLQTKADPSAQARLTGYIDRALAKDAAAVTQFLARLPATAGTVGSTAPLAGLARLLQSRGVASAAPARIASQDNGREDLALVLHWVTE